MQWSWSCMSAFQGKMFQGENLRGPNFTPLEFTYYLPFVHVVTWKSLDFLLTKNDDFIHTWCFLLLRLPCPNVSTTPLRQWSFRQCLPFSWTTLRGKHCRHPIDTFGPSVWICKKMSYDYKHLMGNLILTTSLWNIFTWNTHVSLHESGSFYNITPLTILWRFLSRY
jgi:hypothetical protein